MTAAGLFDVTGLRVLVTGGTSGIGLAISRAFLEGGARVMACGLTEAECAAARAGVGAGLEARAMDLSGRAACEALAEAALTHLGGIDVLVCSAGMEGPVGPVGACETEAFRKLVAVNVESPMWLAARLAPEMVRGGGGSVVLIASIAAARGNRAIGAYGMTKAAVCQLARNLAVQWGGANLRANAILPGLIETPFATGLMADAAFMAERLKATPLGRVGQPEEIAGAALFLASRAGGFVTGQSLVVDGGTLIRD